jgi:uncharacterized membrane protein YhaH (DUF805 family)
MFNDPFSFDGRIRRTEYGISFIIYYICASFINAGIDKGIGSLGILYIPAFWFLWAQGAKRCHDLGRSGWWQIVPFYGFWLFLQKGLSGTNQYGHNPKEKPVGEGAYPQAGTVVETATELEVAEQDVLELKEDELVALDLSDLSSHEAHKEAAPTPQPTEPVSIPELAPLVPEASPRNYKWAPLVIAFFILLVFLMMELLR